MKTSSAKAKGARCAKEVKALMHKYAPVLDEGDVYVTPSGVTGPDLHLSPHAKSFFNLAPECKNCESISIWSAFEQAESHVTTNETPILFYKRNRSELMVALKAEDFFKLIKIKGDMV